MSLINDALKRAKDSQPATTPAPEPEQPMKPVEPQPGQTKSTGLPPYFLPAVLLVLSGACWFLIKGWETKRQAGIYPQPITVHAREISAAPEAAPAQSEVAATDLPKAATADSPATAVTVPAIEPTPAPEPPPRPQATFKLQGIFYRASNPSAVINAKTVFIGDSVDEAKVKAIDRQSVTLIQDGQTKVLTLY